MPPTSLEAIADPELRLILACARAPEGIIDATAIRRMLECGIDWSIVSRQAMSHGLVSLLGNTIEKVAPEMVPDDLLDAFRTHREYVRSRNDAVSEGFRQTLAALASHGVDAISFNGPILGIHAYGSVELRAFVAPVLLVREHAVPAAITALRDLGYQQQAHLTASQLGLMRYLQGRETLSNRSLGISAELCTRLTSLRMVIDIDHDGLWRRAGSEVIAHQAVRTLAPEDELLALSIRHGEHTNWRLAEACDFAALVASQPSLDWDALQERARAQGCLSMLRLAAALASRYFGASGGRIAPEQGQDPLIDALATRTAADWQAADASDSLDVDRFSLDLLRLHDGSARKARYAARCLLLPTLPHISRIALPRSLTNLWVYALLKIVQNAALLPLVRTARWLRAQVRRLRQLPRWWRYRTARAVAERRIAQNPKDRAAWQDLGDALFGLRRHAAAIAAYDKALEAAPESTVLFKRRAAAVRAGGQQVIHFDTVEEIRRNPEDANVWARHAASLAAEKRYLEATIAADRALAINPAQQDALIVGIRSRIQSCDWRRSAEDERQVAEAFSAGRSLITPAGNRAICDSEAQNLVAAQLWARPFVVPKTSLQRPRTYHHDRIRLGYICSEYHEHPVGWHIAGVFEHHDRTRFEITAISLGGPNSSSIRQRIQAGCDRFISVHDQSDERIAELIREMEIDIAIDLDRFAAKARPGILARRPAALQVTYFGNAGTTAAPFFDYIVADRTLIPTEHLRYYTEKVIYLPNSYQCNDSKRQIASTPTRAEVSLPETGFVYCCFNQSYKIRRPVFEVWMRLLHACPGSVLWLLGDEPDAALNLRREAAAMGIAPERLVFAAMLPNADHLARHRLADLFLDTLPCNAHVTASDALWAGLPVLTCLGNTFSGRVGASLLRALGLPELVTESLPQYEQLAMCLTRDPQRLGALRATLARNRSSAPLFDTARFTRDLEGAFETIWHRRQADLVPEAVAL